MQRHRKANAFDSGVPGDPRLHQSIERRTPGVAGGSVNHFFGGTVITPPPARRASASATSASCPFGQIIDIENATEYTKGIRGGLITCGDKNFNVEYQGIDTATNSVSLIQIKITGIERNTDDDGEIIIPGVKTATGTPEWENQTVAAGYSPNINPDNPTADATVVIPLGKLTIKDGAATFEPTGCGSVSVSQCAGVVNYSRQ